MIKRFFLLFIITLPQFVVAQSSVRQMKEIRGTLPPAYGEVRTDQQLESLKRLQELAEKIRVECENKTCNQELLAYANYYWGYSNLQFYELNSLELKEKGVIIDPFMFAIAQAKQYFKQENSPFYYRCVWLISHAQVAHLEFTKQALDDFRLIADSEEADRDIRIMSKFWQAWYFMINSAYFEALNIFAEVLRTVEELPQSNAELVIIDKLNFNIAQLYSIIESYDIASSYYMKSMECSMQLKDTLDYLWTAFEFAEILVLNKEYDQAQELVNSVYLLDFSGIKNSLFFNYVDEKLIGLMEFENGNYQQANQSFNRVLELSDRLLESQELVGFEIDHVWNTRSAVYMMKAELSLQDAQWNDFENNILAAIDYTQKSTQIDVLPEVMALLDDYRVPDEISARVNDYYTENYYEVYVIQEREKLKAKRLLDFQEKIDAINKENESIAQKDKSRQQLIIWGLVAIVGFVVFVVFILKKQFRLKEEEINKERLKSIGKQKELKLGLKEKLLQHTRQLELLEDISQSVSAIKNEDLQTNLIDTIAALKNGQTGKQLEEEFIELNKEYVNKLLGLYPKLTKNNLILCLLIKSGFSTKEIAEVKQISPPSVKIARNRLRKKLSLEPGASLFHFFNSIQ